MVEVKVHESVEEASLETKANVEAALEMARNMQRGISPDPKRIGQNELSTKVRQALKHLCVWRATSHDDDSGKVHYAEEALQRR